MYTWLLSCLRGHNLVLFSIGHNVLLHWIQNSLSQQPEIVFSWNKRINWAYSFVTKSRRVFVLFKSTFFRNRSFSNAYWFYSKNRKIWKGNLYLRGYCTPGPYFWRLCAFSQRIKQHWSKYPMDLVRNVPRNSKITVLLQ